MKEKERAVRKRAALLTVDKGKVSFNKGETKVNTRGAEKGAESLPLRANSRSL